MFLTLLTDTTKSRQRILFIYQLFILLTYLLLGEGCLDGITVKALDCEIIVSEFDLQSRYYVHIRTITLGES